MSTGIWREGLHQLFWERRYGDDLVEINQTQLADQLHVTKANLNISIKAMVEHGWLTLVDGKIYRVTEPDA